MRIVPLAALLLALAAAPADARLQRELVLDVDDAGPVATDLDGDGTAEQILKRARADGFTHVPRLTHPCGLDRRIGPRDERVAVETVRVRGKAGPPLLFVSGSSGATGRIQRTRLHRLDPPQGLDGCPSLTTLFRFPHRSAERPRPPRGTAPGSFSAAPRDVDGRIWMRTFEGLYRLSDPGCCPSFVRRILWRPRGDTYVRARTRVRRLGAERAGSATMGGS